MRQTADQAIWGLITHYQRPFHDLPEIEQLDIAKKVIEEDLLFELFGDTPGTFSLSEMMNLACVGDANALLAELRRRMLVESEAEERYTTAYDEWIDDQAQRWGEIEKERQAEYAGDEA